MELSEYSQLIIGLLSGSLGTIILKSLIEFFSKKIEFKRELRKKFFERKIDAADKAVAAMYSTAINIGNLSLTYDLMSDPDKEYSYEYLKNLSDKINVQLQKITDAPLTDLHSIYLYSDFSDKASWTDKEDLTLIDSLSDLADKDKNLSNAISAYEYSLEHDPKENQEKIWSDIKILVHDYKSHLKKVSVILNDVKAGLMEQRKLLRDEFRKYD